MLRRCLWTSNGVGLLAVSGLLLAAVGLVFGQTAGFDFVNYDDDHSVYENRLVTGDVTPRSLLAVLTQPHFESWAPLTCLSHIVVWHLLGPSATFHHLTNVLLHATSAVLLFLVLWRMTDHFWPSAVVAAVFAVHPLRVESVAWVTERKDVLSGLFFVLTLAAYLRYVRRPFSLGRYLVVLACFVAGLAAKPMAVTMPFLLALLDYWPLGRINGRKSSLPIASNAPSGFSVPRRLILEKIPLLAIACFFCLLTIHGQQGALEANRLCPIAWRIGNALVSYVFYLGKFFYPVELAALYARGIPAVLAGRRVVPSFGWY